MKAFGSLLKPCVWKWEIPLLYASQRCGCIISNRTYALWRSNSTNDWNKAVSHAEKVVGYPTSFLSIRYLLSDELSNVAIQMRKLVGTRHPLLKTAKGLLYDSKHNLQSRGLIVLLIAKAAGPCPNSTHTDNMIGGIYPSQRSLAEITEMIHTANLIHKGVLNLSQRNIEETEKSELHFGNKIAILSGDFLMASACTGLAELKNTKVVEMVSESIKEIMESEFTDLLDSDGNAVLNETIKFSDWCHQVYLSFGSLLGNSCQAATLLAGHGAEVQESAYQFGINLGYAHQLNEDLKPFLDSTEVSTTHISATAGPIVNLIEKQGSHLMNSLIAAFKSPANTMKVMELVDDNILKVCREQSNVFERKALEALDIFEPSEAKTALKNILLAVTKS